MERLTEWRGEHAAVVNNHANYIDRLAAYEDTGLEPEEVAQCRKYKDNHFAYMAREGMYIARPDIELMIGVGADKWKEIALADKEGRLVVLPCKVGDTVFFVIKEKIYEAQICILQWYEHSRGVVSEIRGDVVGGSVGASISDFGKTVFFTREEAEAALKKG